MKPQIDIDLIDKISKKINKSKKYVREQVSKRANRYSIQSQATVIVWAKSLGINTARVMSALPPYLQSQVQSGIEYSRGKKNKTPDAQSLNSEPRIVISRENLPGFKIKAYDIHLDIKNVTKKDLIVVNMQMQSKQPIN